MRPVVGILLLTCCFTLGVIVEPRLAYTQVYARHEKGPVEVALGEARRLFAGYFFTKADVYFHSGYYPSIFDQAGQRESHMATDAGAVEEKNHGEGDFMGKPRDWIDRFSRSFYPSTHTHLGASGVAEECNDPDHREGQGVAHANEDREDEPAAGDIREILPWLSIAAELDPNRIETYTVGAFWLRTRMNKPKEAEAFLRQGLRDNPGSYAILFELGRIFHEAYKDSARARNVLEYALKRWNEQEGPKQDPDTFLLSQITWQLALLEQERGNRPKAISYLETAKRVSPNPAEVEKRIEELKAGL
jgi:tetratricopeptide (TPR) repeat protein